MDISAWLRELGLERYEKAFRNNDVDAKVLPHLTAEDLKDIGITSVGHRRGLLAAIEALRPGPATPDPEEPSAIAPPAAEPRREAERRQLTVMFIDLVGSTALAARLDPEDMREVMRAYQSACADVVSRFEGHVARFLGDGVLAFFGWPVAHEDDAERAVRAGLQLLQDVARLEPRVGLRLQARVGVATGYVVVGDLIADGVSEKDAVSGDTPSLAARLQALAVPGHVVISPSTRRLVDGLFELTDLGPKRLKGFAEPLRAWQVEGQGRAEGRFEARQTTRLTPIVGRENEMALLLGRWRQAQNGEGQVVLLSGEPGIGKSRLVRELDARLENKPHHRLFYQCSSYHTNSPLHPVIEQLERAIDPERDDSPATRLRELEALLMCGKDQLDQTAPLIAALLGLPTDDRYPPLDLTAEHQKQRTLEVLVDQLEGLSTDRPVLSVYEDIHWIDPTTLELLDLVVERIQRLPVLCVFTFRPEFSPPWTGQPRHVSALPLTRLGPRDGASIVERVAGAKTLPAELSAQIVAKTDGVPLFVEELTKNVLESGLLRDAGDCYELSGPLPPLTIPATLHASLLARLDRLAPVKKVAQIGAVLGREFSHELLAAVASGPEASLRRALDQLVEAELMFRRGMPPEAKYTFKHALVQEAAYGTLLRSRRQQLHARVVRVLEDFFPDTAETQPELLAYHCTRAGLREKAVDYWCRAGTRSIRRSAMAEAVAQLSQGLELLAGLPEGPERDRRELDLQLSLAVPMFSMKWGSAEVERVYARARELCERLGDNASAFVVLRGLWHCHFTQGLLDSATELAAEMLGLANLRGDPVEAVVARRALGATFFFRGMFTHALEEVQQGWTLWEAARPNDEQRLVAGEEPGIMCRLYAAYGLWFLGQPEHALVTVNHAVREAQGLAHPYSLAFAHCMAAQLHQYRREPWHLKKHAAAGKAVASEHRFALLNALATTLDGWADAFDGQVEPGLAEVRRGLALMHEPGRQNNASYFPALLAEALAASGRLNEAIGILDAALASLEQRSERFYVAELHRLKGELLHRSGGGVLEVARKHLQAIAIARDQGSKSLELRAANSLARVWLEEGERQRAFDLLAPIYGWFTEGFDTADLKDAKALLEGCLSG